MRLPLLLSLPPSQRWHLSMRLHLRQRPSSYKVGASCIRAQPQLMSYTRQALKHSGVPSTLPSCLTSSTCISSTRSSTLDQECCAQSCARHHADIQAAMAACPCTARDLAGPSLNTSLLALTPCSSRAAALVSGRKFHAVLCLPCRSGLWCTSAGAAAAGGPSACPQQPHCSSPRPCGRSVSGPAGSSASPSPRGEPGSTSASPAAGADSAGAGPTAGAGCPCPCT